MLIIVINPRLEASKPMKIKYLKLVTISTLLCAGLVACGGGGGGSSGTTSSGAATGEFQTPPTSAVVVSPKN